MFFRFLLICFVFFITLGCSVSKLNQLAKTFYNNKNEYITNNSYRNWWNVKRYDIRLLENFEEESIENLAVNIEIAIERIPENALLQIDLDEPMQIKSITVSFPKEELNVEFPINQYKKKDNSHIIDLQPYISLIKYSFISRQPIHITVESFGKPSQAKNAPWDGGWVFAKDSLDRPFISAAVQNIGCSAWFPCKNYLGDEPEDGMEFHTYIKEPSDLIFVSNGKKINNLSKNHTGWLIESPINNYNIIPYYGFYENFSRNYQGVEGDLFLDFYPLDYNLDKAKKHFAQVEPMLACFEDWLGPYPYYKDGFKLVEAPYFGMEHQSAIAYGNNYQNGYYGRDLSSSGWGLKFDYIIVHEAAHEWFGNSITALDPSDLWLQEGFTTYSEALFVECQYGTKAANEYILGSKRNIKNQRPIQGKLGSEGSQDMYYKMASVIHTLRYWIDDDTKFKNILQEMNKNFYHKIVTGSEIEDFFALQTNLGLKPFFDQYLRTTNIPTLEYYINKNKIYYRFTNVVEGFSIPIFINNYKVFPTQKWQNIILFPIENQLVFNETPLVNFVLVK